MALTGRNEFSAALNQVAHERGLDPFEVLDTIKAAVLAAYRRDYEPELEEDVEAQIDAENGEVKILKEGKDITPAGFGRIAAQTAKQVLLQRIREAEKTAILEDYSKKIGTIVSGMIQRAQGPAYIVDIGRAEAVMPPREQTRTEQYYLNQRLKFYIVEIRDRDKRSEIIVSRTHPELVAGLFKSEVPEINAGSVEIKGVAREAGFRTKIAVASTQTGVDPVGSCVGQRGNRIQTVINELSGEKIDVIAYNEDPIKFITAALQPAKNARIEIVEGNEEHEKRAQAFVPEDELSLAIGSKGQNVRLASQLTGYHIDIVSNTPTGEAKTDEKNIFTDDAEKKTEAVASEGQADDTSTLVEDTQTTEDTINALGETEAPAEVVDPSEEATADVAIDAAVAEAEVEEKQLEQDDKEAVAAVAEAQEASTDDSLQSTAEASDNPSDEGEKEEKPKKKAKAKKTE